MKSKGTFEQRQVFRKEKVEVARAMKLSNPLAELPHDVIDRVELGDRCSRRPNIDAK